MTLRIPLTQDQTLQVEFHEIERRLRKLEKSLGRDSTTASIRVVAGGSGTDTVNPSDLAALEARLAALEAAVLDLETELPPEFGAVGSESAAGIVMDPGVPMPPTGLAEHVLKEDATWGFPFRGLVQVTTPGDETDKGTDAVNIEGTLTVNADLSAHDIEARRVRTIEGVTLEGDSYQVWSDERGLVFVVTEQDQTDQPDDVVNILADLHTQDILAADVECYNLHTGGDIEYTHSFWDDLRFPATGFNPAGSTAPPAILTTNGLLSFAGNADNIIGGIAQMPHHWKEGTSISPHIHLVFPTAATANTRWLLEYNVANINADFTTDSVTYTSLPVITVANANNIARHVLAEFEDIPMTGKTMSCCVLWRLSRLAASDGADNDTNACSLLEFDLHYETDSPGSSLEYTK